MKLDIIRCYALSTYSENFLKNWHLLPYPTFSGKYVYVLAGWPITRVPKSGIY